MTDLSEAVRKKFDRPLFWQFATQNGDGAINVKPMWIALDGETILITTKQGCRKHRNVLAEPRITLALIEPDNPYERVEIRGLVEEIVEGPVAEDTLDAMARVYLGTPGYPWRKAGERHVMFRITPVLVIHHIDDDDPDTPVVA